MFGVWSYRPIELQAHPSARRHPRLDRVDGALAHDWAELAKPSFVLGALARRLPPSTVTDRTLSACTSRD